ncbi:MAG: hypothetical protein MJ168_06105 [Clostridia bacterium]|nr:hypothetical protein [Clostridia bacterium]
MNYPESAIFNAFPKFSKEFTGDYNCRENCYLRLYKNADKKSFFSYIEKLKADGFEVIQQNEIDGNLFAVLGGKVFVTLFYTPCDSILRVTASEENQNPNFDKTDCSGKCQTTFYAFENDHTLIDCGMCLIVQCPDYSFFIVDSGHYFQFNDNDRIYKFMRERTPAGQKVVVNGWMITHAHTDHISKLSDFLKYNTNDVIIEGFYQNLLDGAYECEDWNTEEREMSIKFFKILENYPAPVYKLHTGMRFYIRNLTFNVMSTHEDIYPKAITDYNDSSCVVMMEAEGSKVFIPGDAAVDAGEVMEQRFSDSLKCDIVQIAHHGHTGLSPRCYELLGADLAIFPITRIMFDEELPRKEANRRAIAIANKYYITSDGTVVVPLPYNKETVTALPDETFEDFAKIQRIWRYKYTKERKAELYDIFLQHGGSEDALLLPTSYLGFIEPKPLLEDDD